MEQESIEAELEGYMEAGAQFSALPGTLKLKLGNKPEAWEKMLREFCYQRQKAWEGCPASKLVKSVVEYYEQLLNYSLEHLMVRSMLDQRNLVHSFNSLINLSFLV